VNTRRRCGFTLIELLVVLAVLSLLATLTVPMAQVMAQRSKEQDLRMALRSIREAIDAYKRASDEGRIRRVAGESGYPRSLERLVEGEADLRDPRRRPIYFLRRLPRDPFAADPTVEAATTWQLRSYASEADDPQPGDDVYDVRSRSAAIGLNGIAHAQW
jgi:prepilin-type N-terminal cleavage/methylation domain-containing protein